MDNNTTERIQEQVKRLSLPSNTADALIKLIEETPDYSASFDSGLVDAPDKMLSYSCHMYHRSMLLQAYKRATGHDYERRS